MFLNDKLYNGEVIKEQYLDNKHHWIITLNKSGEYVLYCNDNKTAQDRDATKLHKLIKGYKNKGK